MSERTSSGGSATAPTSSMWKSAFPPGKDPRSNGSKDGQK